MEARPSFFVREREVGLSVRVSDPGETEPDPSQERKTDLNVKEKQILVRQKKESGSHSGETRIRFVGSFGSSGKKVIKIAIKSQNI